MFSWGRNPTCRDLIKKIISNPCFHGDVILHAEIGFKKVITNPCFHGDVILHADI